MRTLLAAALVVGLSLVATPTAQARSSYYDKPAARVAKSINCRGFEKNPREAGVLTSGSCRLAGKRVAVITFRRARQQAAWKARALALVQGFYPPGRYYFAESPGAVVGHKDFRRRPARVAARRLAAGRVVVIKVG